MDFDKYTNMPTLFEHAGGLYVKTETGKQIKIPDEDSEIFKSPSRINIEPAMLRRIVYSSLYPFKHSPCSVCGRLYRKMYIDKYRYMACICGECEQLNEI